MKWVVITLMLATIWGCAYGRCWDTPTEYTDRDSLRSLSGLTLYVDGDVDLVERALIAARSDGMATLTLKKVGEENPNAFPFLRVRIEPPKWDDLTSISYLISGITLSILPGYAYQSSEISLQLTLPDGVDHPLTTNHKYAAKRHYVSWLPLGITGNFV